MLFQYIKLAQHNIFLVTLLSNIELSKRACCRIEAKPKARQIQLIKETVRESNFLQKKN